MTVGNLLKMCETTPGKVVHIFIDGQDKRKIMPVTGAVVKSIYMSGTAVFIDAEYKEKKK